NGLCGFQTQSRTNCVVTTGGTPTGTPGFDPDGTGPSPCVALCQMVGGYCSGNVARCCGTVGAACTSPAEGTCTAMPALPAAVSGMWHTGDGTATADTSACGNYGFPFNSATPARAEILYDVLFSPVVQKVHQGNDAGGFPYTVEFQRLGYNANVQFNAD